MTATVAIDEAPQTPRQAPTTDAPEVAKVDEPEPDADQPSGADGFRLRGTPPTVMRLSRKAMATIGVVAAVAIGATLIYALQPVTREAPDNLYDTESRNRSEAVTGAPADYAAIPKLGPPLPGDLGGPIVAAQQNGEFVPVPPIASEPPSQPAAIDPRRAAADAARERLIQERDGARTSRLFLGSETVSREANSPAAIAASANGSAPTSIALPIGPISPRRAFLEGSGNRETSNAARLLPPLSPYVLQAGSIIPAALITGIRSDLPGQITAQVTQNVYDSPTGRILLIPQGARLIGQYDSEIIAGQNRVLLEWDRLIMPGGRSIALERQPGADASGMAGLEDRTDYHWGQLFRAALVSTLLGVGSELATNDDSALVRALRTGTQDSVAQTGRQVVERQLGQAPTLTIGPGFSLRVIVTRDLVLEPIGPQQ